MVQIARIAQTAKWPELLNGSVAQLLDFSFCPFFWGIQCVGWNPFQTEFFSPFCEIECKNAWVDFL